ncbi:rhomboid family intramembrane serine protease [Chengkuizengella sediminis]|uniref:rhomboid family intramembrane serine protease n=1 Tax=Chengkuizengella sediminis TaxID=1885917 RepID=UPI00138A517A|nr:rhomboid family intramembrane serine protease [Chengkuizengella sediminis]NDI36416.1 rhomboid family intramembrane serine protease [Chengkuizengella sediminis]
MIFLRFESFREYLKLYPVTAALLGLNLIMFIVTFILSLFYGEIVSLYLLGALIYPSEISDLWRIISSMFLHGGFEHFLFNGFSLFLFGPALERLLGKLKYSVLYFCSGIVGNIISIAVYGSEVFSVGASGAIYGLLGAYLFIVIYLKHRIDPQSRTTVIVILSMGMIYSFINENVNIYAHIGGLAAGFVTFSLMIRKNHI